MSPYPLHDFQKQLIVDIESMSMSNGGYKVGEMAITMAGRQAGKSTLTAAALKRLMEDIYNRPLEDLVLSEGKVFGARYYCAEPIGGNWVEMERWCKATMGDASEVWEAHDFIWPDCGRWYMNNRRFWFRDEKDRMMFIMKWR